VRRRRVSGRFACLRRHAISKACAFTFLTLILLPFTAPFPSYDLWDSVHAHPHHALPNDIKDIKDRLGDDDKLAELAPWSLVAPILDIIRLRDDRRASQLAPQPPSHIVLRL
jgi:hypothetical protein